LNWRNRLAAWRADPLLRRVVKNSSYLASSNTIAAGLSFIQGILVARLLGVARLGEVAAIIAFVTAVNNLLSFRMSEVVVRHFTPPLAAGRKDEAAAIAKGAGLIELATSLVAFSVMLLLAPWAAQTFLKDSAATPLIVLYGLIILSNIVFETSRGVLQSTHRFGQFASINLAQSVLTFALISIAFLTSSAGVPFVLGAYIAGKTLAGVVIIILAVRGLNENLPGWWRVPLRTYSGWRGLFTFALNTNLNGTVNIFVRDNIPLYIATLTSTVGVGYFRIAYSLTNVLMTPVDPFISPTYTEITRTIAEKNYTLTRQLLRRVSSLIAVWVAMAGGFIALFGWWLIPLLYGKQYAPAYPAAVLLLIGYGVANIFSWNRPLLLALGKPTFPLVVATAVGAVELALIFRLVPIYGYIAAAAILSGYLFVSVGINVWRGLIEIKQRSTVDGQT
jgi:O-antigen/teichoic acid export membrane protein